VLVLVAACVLVALGGASSALAADRAQAKPPRLQGSWTMSGSATSIQNGEIFGVETGPVEGTRTWRFTPKCARGACDVVLSRELSGGGTQEVVLDRRSGNRYIAALDLTQVALTCDDPPVEVEEGWLGTATFTVQVTRSAVVGGKRLATRIKASLHFLWDNSPAYDAVSGCSSPLVEYRFDLAGRRT
jgi:hypothetical protein